MDKLEKIIEECPNVKMGLDDFYGKQTMLNALKRAYNQALEDFDENVVYDKNGCLMYKNPIENLKIK